MKTVFDIDPGRLGRYPLKAQVGAGHAHLHALPDAHRVFVVGGPRHEHQFHAAVLELLTDSSRSWCDDRSPNRIPRLNEGFVYAAQYDSHPGRVKIGRTAKLPEERLSILSRRTSAPGTLRLLYAIQTPMMTDLEGSLHRAHGHNRRKGEWFAVEPAGLLASILGSAHAHDALDAECRTWISSHALGSMSPDDMRLLRAAGLGKDPERDCTAATVMHMGRPPLPVSIPARPEEPHS